MEHAPRGRIVAQAQHLDRVPDEPAVEDQRDGDQTAGRGAVEQRAEGIARAEDPPGLTETQVEPPGRAEWVSGRAQGGPPGPPLADEGDGQNQQNGDDRVDPALRLAFRWTQRAGVEVRQRKRRIGEEEFAKRLARELLFAFLFSSSWSVLRQFHRCQNILNRNRGKTGGVISQSIRDDEFASV